MPESTNPPTPYRDDRPVQVTGVTPATNTGVCTCSGVVGRRMTHMLGQPGCTNG